jgi:glycosyltransferase involved in cell wall biosynthesis
LGEDVLIVAAGSSGEAGVVSLGELGRFHATPVPSRLAPLRRAIASADVVHVVGYRDPVGTVALLEARRRHVPALLEAVGMLERRVRSLALKGVFDATLGRAIVAGVRVVIVSSSVEATDVTRAGIPPDRIRVRPNGVDVDELLPLPARGRMREGFGIDPQAPLVLSIARLSPIKRHVDLVRAVATIERLHLLIAGPDEGDGTAVSIRDAIRAAGIEDRAHLLVGGLWGAEKAAALADADVFALPSAYESFGSAAAEAACVGLPVVLTDRCGVKDVLAAPGPVPPGDVSAFAETLRGALAPDARQRSLAEAATVRERLSWSSLAEAQLEIYRAAIG